MTRTTQSAKSAEAIKTLRATTGMTQTQFAKALGLARSLVAACEGAARIPSTDMHVRLGNLASSLNLCDSALHFYQRAGIAIESLAVGSRKGMHRTGYRAPRIGEKRQQRKPLRIDRLSAEVKDTIIESRNSGHTWKETAEVASAKAGLRLAASTVQRWYDLRIEQPGNDALRTERQKQIIAGVEEILKAVRS